MEPVLNLQSLFGRKTPAMPERAIRGCLLLVEGDDRFTEQARRAFLELEVIVAANAVAAADVLATRRDIGVLVLDGDGLGEALGDALTLLRGTATPGRRPAIVVSAARDRVEGLDRDRRIDLALPAPLSTKMLMPLLRRMAPVEVLLLETAKGAEDPAVQALLDGQYPGCAVRRAMDEAAALAALAAHPPDIVAVAPALGAAEAHDLLTAMRAARDWTGPQVVAF